MPRKDPLPLDEMDRIYLEELRALNEDDDGREIFVGLSRAESEEYLELMKRNFGPDAEARRRYLQLTDKKEAARREVLAAESASRDNPTRH